MPFCMGFLFFEAFIQYIFSSSSYSFYHPKGKLSINYYWFYFECWFTTQFCVSISEANSAIVAVWNLLWSFAHLHQHDFVSKWHSLWVGVLILVYSVELFNGLASIEQTLRIVIIIPKRKIVAFSVWSKCVCIYRRIGT